MSASLVPPWADPFLARDDILTQMRDWVLAYRARDAAALMLLQGLEGLGESCLVTEFSRRNRELVDLDMIWLTGRDTDGRAVPLGELLTRTLRHFGVAAADQGETDDEKADTLVRVSRDKRFLVVIDNMDSNGQLEPFADAARAGRGGIVIATRAQRRSIRGFKDFVPDELSPADAEQLFRFELHDTAARLDTETVSKLVAYCGGLPLLVKVLAAHIRGHAARAPRLLARLRDTESSVLDLDDEQRLKRFLTATYQDMDPELDAAYRTLAAVAAATYSVEAAAATLNMSQDKAFDLLDRLYELSLINTAGPDHYAFHTALRDEARARAMATERDTVVRRATADWVTHVLREALPRASAVSERWWVAPVQALVDRHYPDGLPVITRADALAWFDRESANLAAAVRAAHRARLHDMAWQLCVVLWKHFHLHGLYDAWIATHQDGLASAELAHSEAGVMQVSSQLGAAYLGVREFDDARAYFSRSLEAARNLGHALGEQSAQEWLGKVDAAEGDHRRAIERFGQSREFVRRVGDAIDAGQRDRVFALLTLQECRSWLAVSEYARATEIRTAVTYFEAHRETEAENMAKCLLVLGRAHLGLGELDSARTALDAALAVFTRENLRKQAAEADTALGNTHRAAGRLEEAAAHYRAALAYYQSVGSAQAETIGEILDQLGH